MRLDKLIIGILILHFFNNNFIFCQEIICKSDTNYCYKKVKFISKNILLEKKWNSIDLVSTIITPFIVDIDNDCIPELIIVKNSNEILIYNTITFQIKKIIKIPNLAFKASDLTLADIDSDNIPEIFFCALDDFFSMPLNESGRIMCYNVDGSRRWISNQKFETNSSNQIGGHLSIADFDKNGVPELYIGNKIFNAITGVKLADGGTNGLGYLGSSDYTSYPGSIAANLDNDTTDLELAAGYSIYKVKLNNLNGIFGNTLVAKNIMVDNEFRDGFTSVGDINNDSTLDVVVCSPSLNKQAMVYAYSLSNTNVNLIAKITLQNSFSSAIGFATIGHTEKSNPISILFNTPINLNSISYDGSLNFKFNWNYPITDTSGYVGVSLFDFNNDGIQELIVRDETNLSIFDASQNIPTLLANQACLSSTSSESLIIGNIDNSHHAKICVTCGTFPLENPGHLTVFGGPDSFPWPPARSVWNQYAYNPLQINDDLTVPRYQKNQATYKNGKYNNFYQQESLLDSNGMYKVAAASLTGAIQCINYDPLTDEYLVIFDVYNRKDASAIADTNLAVSFYNGDPTNGAALLGIYYSNKKIYRGDSLRGLEFRFSAKNIKDVFMVVNTVRNNSGNFNDGDFIQKECDYTDNISRTVELPKIDTIHAAICQGSQFVFQDSIYTESGEYIQRLSSAKGCDSIYFRIFITVIDSVFVNQKIAICDAFVWNGKNISQSGVYQFDTLNRFGCDSITTLDLTIQKSTQSNSKQTACNRYIWNGTEYTQSGIYQYKTTNAVACDSIAILDLQIHFSDTVVQKISTCNTYSWNGRTLSQSGIYQFDTINQFTCDSVVFLDLQITPLIHAKENHSACDQYFWNGKVYTNSGTYDYLTKNALGCDSMITLDLKINKSDSVFTSQTSCAAIDWNGKNYTQSGKYFHETKNIKGCDSVTTLDLTIIPPKENFINKDICDSITILGRKIDRAGRYDFRLTDVNGCDSIIHYDIAIRSNPSSIKLSACDSLLWNVNGKVYTNSTLITEKFNNQYGCDSSITLDLHIAKSKEIFLEASACKEYFWSETQKILTQSGDYLHLLQTAEQCDSTIHLRLTIHSEYSDTDTIISNKEYT